MTGRALVLRGDARALPLPDSSVDLILTSPPFYALRSYTDGGEHYEGQIGSEATPGEYIDALLDCTREWMRVLKPTGSMFIDIGDKYSDRGHGPNRGNGTGRGPQSTLLPQTRGPLEKSLLLLPERYRIGCVDQLGLIVRAVVIWHKLNCLPESVKDRVRRSHEDWVHLVKQPRYYSAVDEIREPHSAGTHAGRTRKVGNDSGDGVQHRTFAGNSDLFNALGKLPGSVWEIPSEPLRVPERLGIDHFAAYPTEWPRRIIAGWSPPGNCVECGEGRRPVVRRTRDTYYGNGRHRAGAQQMKDGAAETGWAMDEKWSTSTRITGYVCACTEPIAPTRTGVVLDPFGGTGTTALAARALGRIGMTVDRSMDYCRLAAWRTTDPGELAKAMRVEKPPAQLDGQEALFDLAEVSRS